MRFFFLTTLSILSCMLWQACVGQSSDLHQFNGTYPAGEGIYEVRAADFLQPCKSGKQRLICNVVFPAAPGELDRIMAFVNGHPGRFELYLLSATYNYTDMLSVSRELHIPVFVISHDYQPGQGYAPFYTDLAKDVPLQYSTAEQPPRIWLVCEEGSVVDQADSLSTFSKYFR
jgi:hypothetical protein